MTTQDLIILAASTFDQQVKAVTHGERFSSQDVLLALTIAVAVGFFIGAWVYFHYRRKGDRQDRERLGRKIVSSTSPTSNTSAEPDSEEGDSGERRRIRKRRRRREHRPRNPSLQQTGGLPPHRPDDELPKY